jgi:predicted P-loop ATPase
MNISLYKDVFEIESERVVDIDDFLEQIRDGRYEDTVNLVRTSKTETEKKEHKKKLPNVTISGIFKKASNNGLVTHSGFICMDIDHIQNPNDWSSTLASDENVYSCFVTASGEGLAILFKIETDKEKHNDAFDAIAEYLYSKYKLCSDPQCRNLARRRFASFDPFLWINHDAPIWTKYLPKKKQQKYPQHVIYNSSDFDRIIKKINDRGIDITGSYSDWLRIGFGLADKFGEGGRSYFHDISRHSDKYDNKVCDRQYDRCLKSQNHEKINTIATVYYFAKLNGVETISDTTNQISKLAASQKRANIPLSRAAEIILQNETIMATASPKEVEDIVEQVYESDIKIDLTNEIVEAVVSILQEQYPLKFNVLTRRIEVNGYNLDNRKLNTIFLQLNGIFEKLTFDKLERIIFSHYTPEYNPLKDYFESRKEIRPKGAIDALLSSIISDTGGKNFPQYVNYFAKKWVVGVVATIFGEHNPLLLVLSGSRHGSGKTEWFRRLLPKELQRYYAESKLDAGKDDEILMTQKLMIMDDELSGKSKQQASKLKELTSKEKFTLREPYGRYNEDLTRLASLCATTNHTDFINDPTGNRRIIPINVIDIDKPKYNSIDKEKFWMEAYHLYHDGEFDFRILGEDIDKLKMCTDAFQSVNEEAELILKYYSLPNDNSHMERSGIRKQVTNTEIKSYLEKSTQQRLTGTKLGIALKEAGFVQNVVTIQKKTFRFYDVIELDLSSPRSIVPDTEEDNIITSVSDLSTQQKINYDDDLIEPPF